MPEPEPVSKEADTTGLMVGLWLPPDVANKLALPGFEPPEQMHLTLAYLGEDPEAFDLDAIRTELAAAVQSAGHLTGRIGGLGRFFLDDGGEAMVALFDSPGLVDLRASVLDALRLAGATWSETHGFIPHITLAYLPQYSVVPDVEIEPIDITFAELTLAAGGTHERFPLGDEMPTFRAEIMKIDEEQHLVFGWAKVAVRKDGSIMVDSQGDWMQPADLEDMAYGFMLESQANGLDGGDMHERGDVAKLVESMVFTPEKIEKMGIPEGTLPVGWWIGYKVTDDTVWDLVKSGERSMFSIEGVGKRTV